MVDWWTHTAVVQLARLSTDLTVAFSALIAIAT